MEAKPPDEALRREGRSYASRLTVNIPKETLTALKIHAAQRDTTIREVVTDLIHDAIETNERRRNPHA
ncbi:hypothetical protein ACCS67_00700 [Rhizobium brockwellii]|uniref:hypothetical protein n=1 Tax=Rhizobium brockwellii TaxID=3019932 RepID=UPI003F95C629